MYLALGEWSTLLPTGFLVARGTLEHCQNRTWILDTRLSLSLAVYSETFSYPFLFFMQVHNPPCKQGVWAFPLSLAAT
jgi:hypothetical protein